MKKIVITGGKGFFGSRFQKMWERKYQVLTPGSKELDVTNEKVVNEYLDGTTLYDLVEIQKEKMGGNYYI